MSTRTVTEAFGRDSLPSVVNTSGQLILTILMSVMKSEAGTVPKELWGISRALDLVAPRGFVIDSDKNFECYCQRFTEAGRYPIVSLRTAGPFKKPIIIYQGIKSVNLGVSFNHPLEVPLGVEQLTVGQRFDHPLILPISLRELEFAEYSFFNHSLVVPSTLRRLKLGAAFDHALALPRSLEYLKVGASFSRQLTLPHALLVLDMRSNHHFNHPLLLPESLQELYLSGSFNHPITLRDSLHTASIGRGFRSSVTFGAGLRTLRWLCNHLVPPLPNTVKVLVLGGQFQQHVDLVEGLEELTILSEYSLPLVLPSTLTSMTFDFKYVLPLNLPPGCTLHNSERVATSDLELDLVSVDSDY